MRQRSILFIVSFCFLISLANFTSGQIPSNGLVAYYPFNGNAFDESGNSHDGRAVGVTLTTDRFGENESAYYFSGSYDSYIMIPHSVDLSLTNELTLSVWVNLTNSYNDQKILGKATYGPSWGYVLGVQYSQLYPEMFLSDGSRYTTNAGSISDNLWTHLCVTWKTGGQYIGYINGTEVFNISASNMDISTTETELIFGTVPWGPGSGVQSVEGAIDDIRIYNRAISEQEISDLYYENGWTLNQGLVAHYPFDGDANDISGNANNGIPSEITFTEEGTRKVAQFFTASYVEVPDNSSLDFSSVDGVTFAVWTKQEQSTTGDIFRKMGLGVSTDDEYGLSINSNGQLSGAFNGPAQQKTVQSKSSLTLNTWNHVVFLWNKADSKISFYINGVLDTSTISPITSIQNTSVKFRIGHALQDYLSSFIGSLDDLRIYNRALSEQEILNLYQEGGWTGNRELNTIIITHGFTGEGPIIPINPIQSTKWNNLRWQFAMADAVSDNRDIYLIRKGEVYAMDADSLQYADIDADSSIEYVINKYAKSRIISQTKDNIFIFDWTLESAINALGFAEAAADVLASTLVSLGQKYDFLLRHLHFIGHSRGCVVNSEAIERLVYWASQKMLPGGLDLDPEIHMTTLDPHPAGHWTGSLFVPMNDDKVNSDNIGIGVTGWIGDSSKVGYIDNYFQIHFLGNLWFVGLEYYPGLSIYNPNANHNLTDFTDANLDAHGLMHTFYYGTVDTTGEKDEFDEGAVVDRNRWYDQGEMGTNQGFYYSRNRKGNQNLSEIYSVDSGLNSVKEDTKYGEDYLIFNGNFSKTSYANLIPGWTYQGGSTSNLQAPFFNFCGEVSDTNTLIHNFSFIPLDVDYIYFKMRVDNSSDLDKLQIYFDDVLCDEISITKFMWLFKWQQIKIPDICKGKTSRLSFLITTKDQKYSDVLIDDVGFYKGQKIRGTAACPVNFHIYDNLGNHTGPVNDSTIVEEIPGSEYFTQQIDSGDKIKTVYLEPLEQGNFYTFKIESQDTTASFNFVIEDYSDTTKETLLYEYDNIPIEPYTIAKCTVQTSSQIPNLEVDKDGDGNIDTIYSPVIVTTVEDQGTKGPLIITEYNLSQNYPNPFNPTTKISYSLPKSSLVQLKIFNLLGQEIATLVNEEKPAGNYNVEFTINNLQLSSGIYLYRLRAGEYVVTKKMILLK